MKAFGKILGLVILGLLLIIVALGFALTHLFDPNDYKNEIRQLARDKAHVELTLNGDIGWSLFPWLGLELHDASIATLAKPKEPFADLQMLGLSVRAWPLMRREVQMSDIRVEGLNLHLNRDANGHANWDDIGHALPSAVTSASNSSPAPTSSSSSGAPDKAAQPVKLDIDSLTINNASVDYHDERSGRQFSAESIQLSTGPVHENTATPLKMTAFFGTNQPLIRTRTELQGELRFDRRLQRYQLEDMKLSGDLTGAPLGEKTASFTAQGQLAFDGAAHLAQWHGLKLSINQMRALGELNVRDLDKTPQLSGGLSVAQFNVREFLDGFGASVPATNDPTALNSLEMVARLSGTPNSLALEDFKAQLDGGSFTGRVAVDDIAKRALRVQLKGDTLDLDRYLAKPPATANSNGAAHREEVQTANEAAGPATSPLPEHPTHLAWSENSVLPTERLKTLDVQLDLGVNTLTVRKLPITDANFKANSANGLVMLENLRGGLFNGSFEASGQIDARPEVPLITLTQRLNNVPVQNILQSQGQQPQLRGTLDVQADLHTRGVSQKAWVDGLNGTANFVLDNGELVDANLEQRLCQSIATLNRKTLTGDPKERDTPFQELKGTLNISNGVASNPDLKVRIPGLAVQGNGDIDLRVLGLDYRIGVVLEGDQGATPDPACQINPRYADIEWPLHCRGPLEMGAKACRVDKEGLGKIAAKLAGDRLGDKLEEKLGEKVSPELKDQLKGLFKR